MTKLPSTHCWVTLPATSDRPPTPRRVQDLTVRELQSVLDAGRSTFAEEAAVKEELRIRRVNQELQHAREDAELEREVVLALVNEGKTERVARVLVDTPVALLEQAKRLGII